MRFSQLLFEADISSHPGQKLAIKLEIDTRPPSGAEILRTLVVRHMTFALRHYSLSSMMAGKVHALLTRPYPKGRDWFDLLWYRGRRPPIDPNIELLQNALDQTHPTGDFDASHWPQLLRQRLGDLNVADLRADVRPFLQRPVDRELVSTENILAVLPTQIVNQTTAETSR